MLCFQTYRRSLSDWYLASMVNSLWTMQYSTQQEISAYMIPAEVAAMVSSATNDSYKELPPSIEQATKQLAGGNVKGCVRRLRRETQQLTQRLKRLSRTAGRGGTMVIGKDRKGKLSADKEDALARQFFRKLPLMPSHDTHLDLETQLQYHLDQHGNAASRAKLRAADANLRRGLVRRGSNLAPDYSDEQVAAYLGTRFAGCYSSAWAVLEQLRWRMSDWHPRSMLDFGAGPGTLVWAAAEVWPSKLERVVAVEPAPKMTTTGYNMYHMLLQQQKALGDSDLRGHVSVPPVRWVYHLPGSRGSQATGGNVPKYDLVTAGYVLGELGGEGLRTKVVSDLWERTAPNGLLVLIEPGTPAGTEAILAARAQVLRMSGNGGPAGGSAHVVAPCPHDGACPMQGTKGWCHFVQRFHRPELHRKLKLQPGQAGPRIYQDERYSYVVLRKAARTPPQHYALVTPDLVLEDVRGPKAWTSESESDWESDDSDGDFAPEEEPWGRPSQPAMQQQEQQHQSLLMQQLAKAKALVAQRKGIINAGNANAVPPAEPQPASSYVPREDDLVESLIRASIASGMEDEVAAAELADPGFLQRWQAQHPRTAPAPTETDVAVVAAPAQQVNNDESAERHASVQVHDLCDPAVDPYNSEGEEDASLLMRDIFPDALQAALQDCTQWSRIIRPPRKRRGHIMVDLCTSGWAPLGKTNTSCGKLVRQVVRRRDKAGDIGPAGYRLARSASWGDLWPMHYQRAGKITMSKGPQPSALSTEAPPPVIQLERLVPSAKTAMTSDRHLPRAMSASQ